MSRTLFAWLAACLLLVCMRLRRSRVPRYEASVCYSQSVRYVGIHSRESLVFFVLFLDGTCALDVVFSSSFPLSTAYYSAVSRSLCSSFGPRDLRGSSSFEKRRRGPFPLPSSGAPSFRVYRYINVTVTHSRLGNQPMTRIPNTRDARSSDAQICTCRVRRPRELGTYHRTTDVGYHPETRASLYLTPWLLIRLNTFTEKII